MKLPNRTASENRTGAVVIPLPVKKKRLRFQRLGPPRVTKLLAQAVEFDRLLSSGEVSSQADLARQLGLTRARVTQILNLLKLCPEIREHIASLGPETPERQVTEAGLRAVSSLESDEQLRWALRHLPGFTVQPQAEIG